MASLNLLQLAPGGHVGRFVIWTEAAFSALDSIFGTATEPSAAKARRAAENTFYAGFLPRLLGYNRAMPRFILFAWSQLHNGTPYRLPQLQM